MKTTTKKVLLNGRILGAGQLEHHSNLDDSCWAHNHFTPVLVAWARRENIVLHVAGDKAYARIDSVPKDEPHLKFVVTGRNRQVAAAEPDEPSNSKYEPTQQFRSGRGAIENSFHDQKVFKRFSCPIEAASAGNLDEETTVVAVAENLLHKHVHSKASHHKDANSLKLAIPGAHGVPIQLN